MGFLDLYKRRINMNEIYESKEFQRGVQELMMKYRELLEEVVAEAKKSDDTEVIESAYADMEQIGEILEVLEDMI